MHEKPDYTRLVGFETICDELPKDVDFQDETFGVKLGAKVGDVEPAQPVRRLDNAKK